MLFLFSSFLSCVDLRENAIPTGGIDGDAAFDLAEFAGNFLLVESYWRVVSGRGWFRWAEEDVALILVTLGLVSVGSAVGVVRRR